MANAQLLGYGPEHLGQNFFFYKIKKDRSLPEEPIQVILKRRHHTACMVFSHFSRFRLETAKQRLDLNVIRSRR